MIGQSVAHYKVTALLGEGGMGEVYRAHDSRLHRDVALKVLPAALAQDATYMSRFAREAHVLASLNHPNIAAVYGLEQSDGVTALVMELVPGETLAQRMTRGALPIEEAASIALQIAQALEDAHEHGIIHRDLKPTNVKITPEGRVKVLDFGIAKLVESSGAVTDSGLTRSGTISATPATEVGVILGTAGYMSPEQASAQRVDRRADIWAFGVVLLEMLTGKRAWSGETVAHVLTAVLHGAPDFSSLPPALPQRLEELLRRCLTKNVKARLQAIGDARVVLEEYVADPSAFAAPPAVGPLALTTAGRRSSSLVPWIIAALALVVALAAGWSAWRPRAAPAPHPVRLRVEIGPQPLYLGSGSSVALSRDGRYLALALGSGQGRQLHLRPIDQLTSTPLAGTELGYSPFFSPDGRWIGFVTPTHLKKVSVSGGAAITLCPVSRARGASWGDDDVIVFAAGPASGLAKVPAGGGAPTPLTTLDPAKGEFSHRWPQVLPGGDAVLFTTMTTESLSGAAGRGTIEVVEVATGARKLVLTGGGIGHYVASGHLVYISDGTLFAAPFDLQRREIEGTPVPVVQGISESGGAHYDVANDGTLVYLEGQGGAPRYELVGVDRKGTASPLVEERQTYVEPHFSPDGRRLAVEILSGTASDSWVFDLERRTATRLTFGDGFDSVPVWSPDGKWIAYGSDSPDRPGIHRKRADGSGDEEALLPGEGSAVPSSWSHDGRFLLFGRAGTTTGNDIWVLPLEGDRKPQPFLVTEFSEAEAAFSPDGRWVAYQSEESGRSEIYVRPFPAAGGKWQISVNGATQARWQADGKRLYFRSDNTVMTVEVDTTGEALRTGTPALLFQGPFLEAAIAGSIYADFDVRGDGELFAMLRGDGSQSVANHVVVVLGLLDELRSAFPKL